MEGKSMKNPRKQSQNQVKNPRHWSQKISKMTLWKKIIIGLVAVLGISAIVLSIYGTLRGAGNAPRFEMTAGAPAPAAFEDNNNAEFIGASALPEINNNRTLGAPGELVILYNQTSGEYAPALRMDATDKDIAAHVKISPAIAGTWARRGPDALVFRPTHNWPADMKFSVRVDPEILNPDARMNTGRVSFETPALAATVESFNTYPATQKKSVIGVAVVSFNYAVDTKKFADRATVRLDGEQIDFTARFDRFHRTAIITTAPIEITDAPQSLRMKINKIPADDGDASSAKVTANTTIESADNIFKISSIETTVADDSDGLPRQLLLIDMTSNAARDVKWPDYVDLYLLPEYRDQDTDHDRPHKWAADEITDAVLKKSKKLAATTVDFENPTGVYQYALSYDVSEKNDRFIYVSVRAGIPSAAGFTTHAGSTRILQVPYPARSVKIAGSGALLALGGEKKLGITARGGADAAYVNLYKVKSSEINHLISQTYNIFSALEFKSWSFDAYDMSVVFKKHIGFSDTSMKTVNYASVDLGDYLDRTHGDKTGIFIVQTGPSQSQADYSDRRLILLTDLGIVRKINLDRSSDVFVSSITAGAPAPDTEVYVLGRNGNAVWAGRTDDAGRAEIPNLPWNEYKNEKSPVAIVARRGDDVSFIPYDGAYDRHVEYSKFDVDGTYASASTALNAFLFTDRGIYRPGESVVIGGIVKNKSFRPIPGIPVKLIVRDARGRTAFEKTFSLGADGMFDVRYDLPTGARIGEYNFQLYSLNSKNKPQDVLGYASFQVAEFTPDNMKISANIPGADDTGWLAPAALTTTVSLQNMFGSPAGGKRVTARLVLSPAPFTFKEFSGYKFTDNFISGAGLAAGAAAKTITREYDDITTDENGAANIALDIADEIADNTTYAMTLVVHGFESGSGRSVQTALRGRVSNAKYLIGWHANSDLAYINRDASRTVNLIAVDHTAAKTTAADVTMRLMRRENLTSLIKDDAGYYKYQTVTRDKLVSQENITITPNGMDVNLDTSAPGTYYLQILNAAGNILANIEYFVAGDKNTSLESDTNADLQIKLNASEYKPGDDIAVSITAPYTGYGLITIERDKVYAFKWFRANSATSVQHITVPDGFEGTGYVNVSFVRALDSRDIFTTPYTYAVAPFVADTARRRVGIKLNVPETLTESTLDIKYETDRDARLMIFAVNDGILQVARYQLPNPIAHFFKKAALQVETYQILSLILPEYKILHEFAKTGGGDYEEIDGGNGALANPFARRAEKPVAFYSEIITAQAGVPGTVTFDIPDTFNGALRVFAVAAADGGVGAADKNVTVRHPVIVNVNAPLAVAPGDKFDIAAVVTNLTGQKTPTDFALQGAADHGIAMTNDKTNLQIADNTDGLWRIPAQANDTLGNAEISVRANGAGHSATAHATMSVRPITPFTTDIQIGRLDNKKSVLRPTKLDLYPARAARRLYVSYGADAMLRPLVQYLRHYEWNCTEQLISRAMPYVALTPGGILGITYEDAVATVAETIATLKNRQNDDGSFAMWAGGATGRNNESDARAAYVTAYVTWFLNMAKDRGFTVPGDMQTRAVDYLRTYAGTNIRDTRDAAAHAIAIYVVTANRYVTTAYISQFEEWANANLKGWESQLMGQYIAAAYSIMEQSDRAAALASKYRTDDGIKYYSEFDNTIANNAIREYLASKYFGTVTATPTDDQMKYINAGEYSSFTAAALILGLGGDSGHTGNIAEMISVTADGAPVASETKSGAFAAAIPMNAKKVEVSCPDCGTSVDLFWTIASQGYPKSVSTASNGLDIVRKYYDMDGNEISRAKIGDRVMVKIFVRTRGDVARAANAVIVDLLPGGFIADAETLGGDYTFAEPHEDRVVIYADITRTESEYSYTAQAGAAGTFAIAPIYATDMYNPAIRATGRGGTFTITYETDN